MIYCSVSITLFQYRGNKQFRPFFGAKIDPKGRKMLEKIKSNISYWKDSPNLKFDCKSGDKIIRKGNFFLAVNIKIKK